METRKVAYAVVLTAIAVAGGVVLSIPVAGAQISPAQHLVNVLSAILLGPWYAVGVALATSIIRNAIGRGTLFAFPGSMIGAFLSGYVYALTRNIYVAALAEIFGTGVLGSLVSIFLVAPAFINRPVNALVLTASFLLSTIVGSVIGLMAILTLRRAGVLRTVGAEH